MNNSGYQEIGQLSKLYGYKGEYVLISESEISEEIEDWESVFIEIDGLPVPFFIDDVRFTSETSVVIRFEDIEDDQAAREFLGCKVLQLSTEVNNTEELNFYSQFTGFQVVDKIEGEIGEVDQILDYGGCLLLQILKGEAEILIPISETIVKKIDEKKKKIFIEAPEGLISLNR